MFETQRIFIRKFTLGDLDELVRLRSDQEVIKYIGGRTLQSPEAIAKRLKFYVECYDKFGFGMSAMILKETGEMFGWSGLQPLEDTSEIEVGYGMAKQFWSKGLGFECALAWLKFGFEQIGLERIVAIAIPENKNSRRIIEKCGMKYEKTEMHYGSECVFYAVSKDEFLTRQT